MPLWNYEGVTRVHIMFFWLALFGSYLALAVLGSRNFILINVHEILDLQICLRFFNFIYFFSWWLVLVCISYNRLVRAQNMGVRSLCTNQKSTTCKSSMGCGRFLSFCSKRNSLSSYCNMDIRQINRSIPSQCPSSSSCIQKITCMQYLNHSLQ